MGAEINPERYYTEPEVLLLGERKPLFSSAALRRAREQGLRCVEMSRGSRVYKGQWLREWLDRQSQLEVVSRG